MQLEVHLRLLHAWRDVSDDDGERFAQGIVLLKRLVGKAISA